MQGDTTEYELAPRSNGIAVGITVFEGAYEHIDVIADIEPTPKLKFPDKIDPSDERNDLYISLKGPNGEFAQDRKKAAKNVQVRMNVLLDTGGPVECLRRGTGAQNTIRSSEYKSTVYHDEID